MSNLAIKIATTDSEKQRYTLTTRVTLEANWGFLAASEQEAQEKRAAIVTDQQLHHPGALVTIIDDQCAGIGSEISKLYRLLDLAEGITDSDRVAIVIQLIREQADSLNESLEAQGV